MRFVNKNSRTLLSRQVTPCSTTKFRAEIENNHGIQLPIRVQSKKTIGINVTTTPYLLCLPGDVPEGVWQRRGEVLAGEDDVAHVRLHRGHRRSLVARTTVDVHVLESCTGGLEK